MLRVALERGLSALVARWMLEGRADAVLDRVMQSGALSAVEVEKLRKQTLARLHQVSEDGAPYADMVGAALSGMRTALPDVAQVLRSTDAGSARVIAAAVADELARRAAEAARSAAEQWQAPAESTDAKVEKPAEDESKDAEMS
ncbi:MAG: hypothetical protein KC502_01095 [Myxococcales bacterium]|nr:hypothetical protein [Myxococcales bacterium]